MPDKTPVNQKEQCSENDGKGPEIPLAPAMAESGSNQNPPEKKTQFPHHYIRKTFEAAKVAWFWATDSWIGKAFKHAGFWTALATVVMAVATCFYVYYARGIKQQLFLSVDAMNDSRRAQWAYVDIPQQIQIRTTVEKGKVTFWTPEVSVVNDGNTGTFNTLEVINVHASEIEMPDSCDVPDNGKPQHSDIGPHESELLDAPSIPIAAVRSVQSGSHIYIYGRVVYRDVFQFYSAIRNGETRHLREFCYELRLDSITKDITDPSYPTPKSLVIYGPHNCTDGGCSDYCSKVPPSQPCRPYQSNQK